jgi:hypothetical protein
VPVYVGHDKLRSQANIDNRCRDAVHVQFQIDARHPSCPAIDPLHFKYNSAAKQRFVATFLGSRNGLCINSPIIPRFLAEQPVTGSTATSPQLSGSQREWLVELKQQMADHYDLIHDRNASDASKMDACERLWGHLGKLNATSQHPVLWEPDQLTSEWQQLLAPRTVIMASNSPRQQSSASHSRRRLTYRVALHAATPEAAYVIACTVVSYSLMRLVSPEVTAAWDKLLTDRDTVHGEDTTDSSDDDGFQRQRSDRRRAKLAAKRDDKAFSRHQAALMASPVMAKFTALYKQTTELPLLALSTTVSIRPVFKPYISCIIDNFQSIGCNIQDLANDPTLKRIMHSRTEFAYPSAYWSVTQRIGNGVASLWIREEHKELLASLNVNVCTLLQKPQAALRVACTVVRKHRRGRLDYGSALKIFLTPNTKVSPPAEQDRSLESRPSSTAVLPAVPGSYAARVAEGIKRAAENAALNHKPRKEQRSVPTTLPAPPSSPGPVAAGAASVKFYAMPKKQLPAKQTQQPGQPSNSQPTPSNGTSGNASLTISATQGEGSHSDPDVAHHDSHTNKGKETASATELDARLAAFEAQMMHQMEARIARQMEEKIAIFQTMCQRMFNSLMVEMQSRIGDMMEQIQSQLQVGRAGSAPLLVSVPLQPSASVQPSARSPGITGGNIQSPSPMSIQAARTTTMAHESHYDSGNVTSSRASASSAHNGQAVHHG